jgi:hypothetical protein
LDSPTYKPEQKFLFSQLFRFPFSLLFFQREGRGGRVECP